MKRRTFVIKGRFGWAKGKLFNVLRLINGLGKDSDVSSPTPVCTVALSKPVNSLTNYSLEAELKKAQALMYWHMWDRPR